MFHKIEVSIWEIYSQYYNVCSSLSEHRFHEHTHAVEHVDLSMNPYVFNSNMSNSSMIRNDVPLRQDAA